MAAIVKNKQYYKFCMYGFLKNLRFFDAFFILFLLEKRLSFTQIGILYAIREIVTNISEIPSGIVADAFGRRNALLAAFLIYIFSFFIFYFSAGFGVFVAAFILYGIAEAFRSGTHKGMIMDYLALNDWENQKINYYGHTRSWSQLGSAISALVAGVIVFYSGSYTSIFLYSVVPYLFNFLLLASYPGYLNNFERRENSDWQDETMAMIKAFFLSLRKKEVLQIINTTAIHSAYLKAIKDYIQPLMVNVAALFPILIYAEVEKRNGAVIGIIYFVIFLATSFASKMASRFVGDNKAFVSFITLLVGFFFGIFCGAFYHFGFWVFSLLAFIGIFIIENVRKPILTGFMSEKVPNKNLTSVFSAQSLWKTIVTAGIAILVGIVSDRFDIGTALFTVSGSLVILSLFLWFVSKNI